MYAGLEDSAGVREKPTEVAPVFLGVTARVSGETHRLCLANHSGIEEAAHPLESRLAKVEYRICSYRRPLPFQGPVRGAPAGRPAINPRPRPVKRDYCSRSAANARSVA